MRVGTRLDRVYISACFEDHPHACGDKVALKVEVGSEPGSSPCVWGQEGTAAVPVWSSGIIPMRVGTRREYSPLALNV